MFEIISENIEISSFFLSIGALLFASFSSLFSVVNPFAAMPVFVALTEKDSTEDRIRTAKKASLYMFGILAVFLFIGTYVLSFFGISLAGIRIAGGLIIMRAAYSMLAPDSGEKKLSKEGQAAAMEKEDISFSPLALPLLSGPGSIAVVIGLASQAANVTDYVVNTIAIILVVFTAYVILRVAPRLADYLGPTGLNVMTRMMGFIALAISVQFILSGISRYFVLAG